MLLNVYAALPTVIKTVDEFFIGTIRVTENEFDDFVSSLDPHIARVITFKPVTVQSPKNLLNTLNTLLPRSTYSPQPSPSSSSSSYGYPMPRPDVFSKVSDIRCEGTTKKKNSK